MKRDPRMDSLRTPVPLTGADYARVRARVHAELEGSRRTRFTTRHVLAAAAAVGAVALGLATFAIRATTEPSLAPPASMAATAGIPAPPAGGADVARQVDVRTPTPAADRTPEAVIAHAAPTRAAVAATEEEPKELRIHMQTGDPNVRIIWIVNPTIEPSPPALKEES